MTGIVALSWLLVGVVIGVGTLTAAYVASFRTLALLAYGRAIRVYAERGEWERAMHMRASQALLEGAWPLDSTFPAPTGRLKAQD